MALGSSWTTLTDRGPDRMVLRVSTAVRILFALLVVLAGLVLFYGVLFGGESTVLQARNTVPLLLFLATLWGALQEDRWTFDRAAGLLESRYGLLFLARRRRWPLESVERVEVDRLRRGTPAGGGARPEPGPRSAGERGGRITRRDWVRLLVVLKDGTALTLDSARSNRLQDFANRGMQIASFCGAAFSGPA